MAVLIIKSFSIHTRHYSKVGSQLVSKYIWVMFVYESITKESVQFQNAEVDVQL